MKRILCVVALAAALPLLGAEPAGVVVWSGAELKGYGRKLAPRVNEKKIALESLGKFGNHTATMVHREGDGEAELHETQVDFLVVQSGQATLVVGGEMVEARTVSAGEVRGPRIQGGERKPLAPGHIVHIPARVPHQLLVPAGKEITYLAIKVDVP